MSNKKRLFVAIDLPEDVKQRLQEIQKELRRFAIDAKWVKPENVHLTLKFLGYVAEEKMPDILTRLAAASLYYSYYDIGRISVQGLGFFPNARRPNVFWAGLRCSEALGRLQQEIENEMGVISFEKENRAFSPHLTLARFREPKGLIQLAEEIEKRKVAEIAEFQPLEFSLFESVLRPHGAQYTILQSFPFSQSK